MRTLWAKKSFFAKSLSIVFKAVVLLAPTSVLAKEISVPNKSEMQGLAVMVGPSFETGYILTKPKTASGAANILIYVQETKITKRQVLPASTYQDMQLRLKRFKNFLDRKSKLSGTSKCEDSILISLENETTGTKYCLDQIDKDSSDKIRLWLKEASQFVGLNANSK